MVIVDSRVLRWVESARLEVRRSWRGREEAAREGWAVEGTWRRAAWRDGEERRVCRSAVLCEALVFV